MIFNKKKKRFAPKTTQKTFKEELKDVKKDLLKNWNTPRYRSTILSYLIVFGSIIFLIIYIATPQNKRVGYNSNKVKLEYSLVNDSTPSLNNLGFLGTVGNNAIYCHKHVPLGAPELPSENSAASKNKVENKVMFCNNGYVTVFDLNKKVPLYAAYKLNRKNFIENKILQPTGSLVKDPNFNNHKKQPLMQDYANTGYAFGMLAPMTDFNYNPEHMKETLYMTNIFPQAPANKNGIWNQLETDVHKLLMRGKICVPVKDEEEWETIKSGEKCQGNQFYPNQKVLSFEELYIINGVAYIEPDGKKITYGNENGDLGKFKAGQVIPNYLYKIIVEPRSGMSASYLIPNVNDVANKNYHQFLTPIRDIEKETGIGFFGDVARKQQNITKKFWVSMNDNKQLSASGGQNGMLDMFLF